MFKDLSSESMSMKASRRSAILSAAKACLIAASLAVGSMGAMASPQTVYFNSNNSAAVQTLTVDINSADAEELAEVLVGIGEAKAQAIVSYRNQNGPFKAVEDLLQVKGIGQATLANNRDRIQF